MISAHITSVTFWALDILDRAGGRTGRKSSSGGSSSRSGSTSAGFHSSGRSSSAGGLIGLVLFVAVVGGFGYFGWRKLKAKNPAGAAAMAAGAAGLMAAGIAMAKKMSDEAAKHGDTGGGSGSGESGLAAIQAHDPGFEKTAFIASAEKSFFLIQKAWTEQDPDQSRQVMADGVWQTHRTQIEDQKAKGVRSVMEDLAIEKATIAEASSAGGKDTIALRFEAHCKDYEVDLVSGKRKGGDKNVEAWAEVWTYQRSAEATTKTDGGTLSQKCPNCGAPLKVDLAGICKYCKANVMAGDQDWVLVRIDEASND